MVKDKKKKDKKNPDDEIEEREFDEDPFGMGDEFYDMINEQMKKIFSAFPGMFPNPDSMNFSPDMLKKIYAEIFKRMDVDPRDLKNMNPEDLQKMMMKSGIRGPFVFGMNMGFGPDGKPTVNSFGNVKPHPEGETEIQTKRDPLVDIYEEDNELIVVVEVPGINKEDIELRSSPFELEVIAESDNTDPQQRQYQKVISLPVEINADKARARYKNGILEVRLEIKGRTKNKKKINID
jgi:HSP20 family protein